MKMVSDATEDRIAYALARSARHDRWNARMFVGVVLAAAMILALAL